MQTSRCRSRRSSNGNGSGGGRRRNRNSSSSRRRSSGSSSNRAAAASAASPASQTAARWGLLLNAVYLLLSAVCLILKPSQWRPEPEPAAAAAAGAERGVAGERGGGGRQVPGPPLAALIQLCLCSTQVCLVLHGVSSGLAVELSWLGFGQFPRLSFGYLRRMVELWNISNPSQSNPNVKPPIREHSALFYDLRKITLISRWR